MHATETNASVNDVLVVDDHPLFCDALVMTLRQAEVAKNVSTESCLEGALRYLEENDAPDIILLDLNLPDVDGVQGVLRLKSKVPQVPVLVVSSMGDSRIIGIIMQAGAAGYVLKDSPRESIIEAFRTVFNGGTVTPEGYAASQDEQQIDNHEVMSRLTSLTPAQRRILLAICEGKFNKQIAYNMNIAESTVKAHVTAIFRKLGVQNRTQAVLVAQELNFNSLLAAEDGAG